MEIPQAYLRRMKDLLGEEFPALEEAYSQPAVRGIRRNPLKCGEEALRAGLPFPLEPSPFSPLGFYLPPEAQNIGRLPLHHAGAFYAQEPSASAAVTILAPQPGEKVLDLCAAPGGKSTQIASLLNGSGLLWSNEYVRSRTGALLSNLERFGVKNAVVSSCHPDLLCRSLAGFFDRVLVDAPCSGEGMFRRSCEAVRDWSEEHSASCAARQLAILESAAFALREGGTLVYSTCTFSREENEDVVAAFLARRPEFSLPDCGVNFGRPAFLPGARRIFPMDGGEGHFVAKLRKNSGEVSAAEPLREFAVPDRKMLSECCGEIYADVPAGNFALSPGGVICLLPEGIPEFKGLGVLRAGLMLGTVRNGRAEPLHAAFQAAKPEELRQTVSFSADSPEIAAFLRGEELSCEASLRGWCGVSVCGATTGFGKCSGGRLKNHYPKGLRNNR